MKRFRFRLERMLGLLRRKEEELAVEMARALHAVDEIVERQRILDRAKADAEALSADLGPVAGLAAMHRKSLEGRGRRLEAERIVKQEAADKARDRWMEHRRELQALERLREIESERHAAEIRRLEQLEMEELASLARRGDGSGRTKR